MLQGAAASVMALAAIGLLWFGDSLVTGFAVLAAILVGAALGTAGGARAVPETRRERDAQTGGDLVLGRQPAAALGIVAGLDGAAAGARRQCRRRHHGGELSRTFNRWIDGRLASDVYVGAASEAQAREIKAWLRPRPEVSAILPFARAEVQLGGLPSEVHRLRRPSDLSRPLAAAAILRHELGRVASGNAALVSEQMARRMNLTLGDKVQVPTPNGPWTLEVAAIYADYGNPRGQLGVEDRRAARAFPRRRQTRFGLRVTPAAVPQLIAELRRDFKLDDRSLADQAALKAESRKIFNRTFAVTNALNAFTLGIAGIALFTSLLTLANRGCRNWRRCGRWG